MKNIFLTLFAILSFCASAASEEVLRDTTGFRTDLFPDATALIRGGLAGVRVSSTDGNPVGEVSVNIHGVNTLRGDNQPLWIVDGVMLSTDLNMNMDAFWQYAYGMFTSRLNPIAFLDPHQIESIEVLKDAGATAIYGTKGANGVIIVTTRKGVDKKQFLINSNVGLVANATPGLKEGTRTGLNHNHFLSFSGSSDNTVYNFSGTFRDVQGGIAGSSSRYGSFKADFETRANRSVWFQFHTLLSAGQTGSPSAVTYLGDPSMTIAMRDAVLSPSTTIGQWEEDFDDLSEDYKALASGELQINFTPWLYAKAYGGINFQHNTRIFWFGKQTPFGSISPDNVNGGSLSNVFTQVFSANANFELALNRYAGKNHHYRFLVNGAYNGDINDFNTMNGNNFVLDLLRGKGLKTGAFTIRHHRFERKYTHFGAYSLLAYDFKDIAGFDASLRWDTTPRYGTMENHFFPAAKAYFNVNKLAFKDSRIFSTLKIEGGYGHSGLERNVPYELVGNFLSGDYFTPEVEGTSVFFDGVNSVMTREWTVGLSAGFFKDRLMLHAGWFSRKTDDSFFIYQLGAATGEIDEKDDSAPPIWNWSGCEKVFERGCNLANRGFEFSLSARPLETSEWTWNVSANLTVLENKLLAVDPSDHYGKAAGHIALTHKDILVNSNIAGQQAGAFYGYLNDGSGNYLDFTGEGNVDDFDKFLLGNTIPTLYGGLQTSLRFRNFTLELVFDGAAGAKVANLQRIVEDCGKIDGNGNVVVSGKYIESGDFLRLGSAGLKYNVPIRSKVIKDLSVKLSGNNLFTLTGYSGWNPDVNCFPGSYPSPGIDYGSYPVLRTVLLGISAKF